MAIALYGSLGGFLFSNLVVLLNYPKSYHIGLSDNEPDKNLNVTHETKVSFWKMAFKGSGNKFKFENARFSFRF